MLKPNRMLARSGGAAAAIVSAFTMFGVGCGPGTLPSTGGVPANGTTSAAPTDMAVVVEIDVTSSVADSFRASAKKAVADAIVRLSRQPHGVITIYVRKIDHCPGCDEAALATYRIDAVHECTNPFDQKCREDRGRPLREARAIARKIRAIRVPVGHAGTNIRGGLAVAGEILAEERGEKWLVVASDMRPSNTKPPKKRPVIKLDNVHVVVLYACRQGIAFCQERRNAWQTELKHDGAVHPVTFLFSQQMNEPWR
jgi:hypothetical protein